MRLPGVASAMENNLNKVDDNVDHRQLVPDMNPERSRNCIHPVQFWSSYGFS